MCSFVTRQGFTLLLSNHFFGVNVSLGQQMFSFREYTFSTFPGWIVISSFVVSSVFLTTLGIVIVIGRAKKCLDFAVTLYVMHMFLSTLLAGFPTSFTWWAVIVGTGIIVTFVAEAVCMRLELREIPIGSGSSAQVNADIEIGTELKAKDAQAY
mmetsp:Transcript_9246/g.18831  ORF Transcript_9246/g.18831 Transcript_9246/m.18831 type:complete len:154 (-) Transcript_9246:55-516(-)